MNSTTKWPTNLEFQQDSLMEDAAEFECGCDLCIFWAGFGFGALSTQY